MSQKLTADHLARVAVVCIRQSSASQVLEHTESRRRQYALADAARTAGFVHVVVIDDDLGRSGSGAVERPGFQKLVAAVIEGTVWAVYCLRPRASPGMAATGITSWICARWSGRW